MTLASTSSVSVQYKPEAVFGDIFGGSSNFYGLRVTGESLDFTVAKTQSTEINATRSISSQVATSASASGGVQAEFSHGEYDRLMAGAMQDTWTAFGTNGVSAPFTTTTNTSTSFVSSAAFTGAAALKKGQWIRITSAGANNGKLVRISTTTAPTTSIITLHASTPITAPATGEVITIQAARLTHGTTKTSFSVQRVANDTSPVEYFTYKGMTPSKMSLNIASGSLSTISFDFMGKDAIRQAGGVNPLIAGGSGTLQASLTAPIHAGTTATNCVIWAGGVPLTGTYVKSLGLEFDNSLGTQEAVCKLGAVGVRSGTINCTASMQLYFAEGAAFFDQFLANTNTELVFSSTDSDGNSYVFTLPQASVATYKVNAGGKDTDLLVDVTFTALRDAANADAALQKVLLIDRCGIAVSLA